MQWKQGKVAVSCWLYLLDVFVGDLSIKKICWFKAGPIHAASANHYPAFIQYWASIVLLGWYHTAQFTIIHFRWYVVGSGPLATQQSWPNVGLMLAQRRRRWADIRPALDQRFVFVRQSHNKLHRGIFSIQFAFPSCNPGGGGSHNKNVTMPIVMQSCCFRCLLYDFIKI